MKEIKLTKDKIALVDTEDFEELNKSKWHAKWSGHHWYAARGVLENKKWKTIRMHRIILNAPIDIDIDHINGNTLDNRRENLRLCTTQQNGFNTKGAQRDNKLGIKGVYWNKEARKFRAHIMVSGHKMHLGYYNVLGDADSAYRIAEEKYFGEFARNYRKRDGVK